MFKNQLRFISVILCPLLILSLSAQLSSAAEIPARFEFRGAGYGHGVGMSQIGAYGQALANEADPQLPTPKGGPPGNRGPPGSADAPDALRAPPSGL